MALRTRFLLTCSVLLVSQIAYSDDVIDIIGIREEARRDARPGHSESLTPEDETRFQINTHLRERSAFDAQGTGRVSASGFLLPRTRGQDAKATAVFVGPFKLFDPLTGFPLVEDIDLRAFGRLQIHRGSAPVSLANTAPIGTLVFSPRPPMASSHSFGLSHGSPYGSKVMAMTEDYGDNWEGRFYIRGHKADGRYEFFDDKGTPANDQDDQISWRTDNHAQGMQIVPYAGYQNQKWSVKLLGVYNQGQRGIASLGGRLQTHAEVASYSQLTTLQAARRLPESALLPDSVGINTGYRQESRTTEDPEKAVLVTTTRQEFYIFGHTISAPLIWSKPGWSLYVTPEIGDVRGATENVQTAEHLSLRRRYQQFYSGLSFRPFTQWMVELKGRWRARTDGADAAENSQEEDRGSSATLGYGGKNWSFYVQTGREERPPSLFEEYGDGAAILSSPSLLAEVVHHKEWGANYQTRRQGHINIAYFQDTTYDKVVFIPSLANAIKAVNLKATRVAGLELELLYHYAQLPIDLGAGFAKFIADDISTPGKTTAVPFVPEIIGNVFAAYRSDYGTVRGSARQRGASYADVLNQSPLPAVTTYDVSYDFTGDPVACGIQISNITDVKSVAFTVPGTGESGRRAYSELTGYPLPGRTWQTSCTATL